MNFEYTTERLQLKILSSTDASMVLDFYTKGRRIFDPVEADKSPEYYSLEFQKNNLSAEQKGFMSGMYMRYFWFLKDRPDEIIGTCSFSNIHHFPYNSAIIGYKLLPFFQKCGFAIEALECLINAVFTQHHLHRIEAYVLPDNTDSIKLLDRLGFVNECLCRQVIYLNGAYRDHFRYVLINPNDY